MALYHPLLSQEPNFTEPPRYSISVPQDRQGQSGARDIATFPTLQDDLLLSLKFSLDSPRELGALMEFFRNKSGGAIPFYVPSWRGEITLAGPVAAGAQLIPIVAQDYEAQQLTGTPEDWPGRQVWIWHPVHGLYADRVLRVVTYDGDPLEYLDMDGPLPWAVDETTCFGGWAYLARFMEDNLTWDFAHENVADVSVTIRCTRAWTTVERTNPVTPIAIHACLGFTSITSLRTDANPVEPVSNRVSFTAGPFTLHEAVDGYYIRRWAAYPATGGVRMRKKTTGDIWLPDNGGTLSGLFDEMPDTDHLSWAFDQTAFEVIAYQKDTATIELRHFFNGTPTLHEWAGTDPTVVWNYQLDASIEVGDSDVVCYYIRKGEGRLYVRFQRDNFEVEYVAANLPVEPLALKRGYYLDQFYYLDILDTGFRIATVKSGQYPVLPDPPVDPIVYLPATERGQFATVSVTGNYYAAVAWADGSPFDGPHAEFEESATVTLTAPTSYDSAVVYADGFRFDDPRNPSRERATITLSAGVSYDREVISDRPAKDHGTVALAAVVTYTLVAILPGPSAELGAVNLSTSLSYA